MKTYHTAKSIHASNHPDGFRAAGVRANIAKTFEHRYERRKVREQLRRINSGNGLEEGLVG